MNDKISPLERSRQILREIDLELDAKEASPTVDTKSSDFRDSTVSDNKQKPLAGDAAPDNSPIYQDEIGNSNPIRINLDEKSLLQGIILSEILREPKSMRRSRR